MRPTVGSESGQNTFEYLLVIGSVVVALTLALLGFKELIPPVVGHVCPGVDTADGLKAVGTCLGLS